MIPGSVSLLVLSPLDILAMASLAGSAVPPYVIRALVLVVVLGIACAPVGALVNLRSAEFSAEALVHAVFPGIVIGAVVWGRSGIVPAALVVGVVAAVVLARSGRLARRDSSEAGTAVVLTGFFSVGLVILLAKGDMSGQLEALMFGRILEVTGVRLVEAITACVVGVLAVVVTWKEQVSLAFDPVGAQSGRLSAGTLDLVLHVALAAVVVAGATAVGALLAIAFVVLPSATGRIVGRTIAAQVGVSIAVSVSSGIGGLLLAMAPSPRPVSPQAAIVLVMAIALVGAAARVRLRGVRA